MSVGQRGYGMLATVSLVTVLLDQVTKAVVTHYLLLHQAVEVIAGFFSIIHVHNPGAAFGILREWEGIRTLFLITVSLVALAVIVYLYRKCRGKWSAFALSLIAGGAVGNLIDRVRFGEVVDFLDFSIGGYHWPAFNVADTAITVGVIMMVVFAVLKKE